MLKVYVEYIFNSDVIAFVYDDVIDISFDNINDYITYTCFTSGGTASYTLKKNKIKKIRIESTNY